MELQYTFWIFRSQILKSSNFSLDFDFGDHSNFTLSLHLCWSSTQTSPQYVYSYIDDFPSYKPSIFRTRNFHGFPLKGTSTEHLDIWWNKNPWGFPLLPKTQRPKPLNNTICCSKINENHHFLEVDHHFSSINGPFYIATDPLGLPASPPGWAWRRWPRRSAGRGKNHWDQDLRKNV